MVRRDVRLLRLVGMAALALGVGCNRGPGTTRVSGEVKLDGIPLAGAQVRFEPMPGVPGQARMVESDGGGVFDVPADRGLVPGEYRVLVTAYRPTGQKRPNPYIEDAPPIDVLELAVPEIYTGSSSPLLFTVPSGDAGRVMLELTGPVKKK